MTRTPPCLFAKRETDLYQKRPALKSAAAANPSLTEAWVNDINDIHLILSKLYTWFYILTYLHYFLYFPSPTIFPFLFPSPEDHPSTPLSPPPPPLSSPSTLDARGGGNPPASCAQVGVCPKFTGPAPPPAHPPQPHPTPPPYTTPTHPPYLTQMTHFQVFRSHFITSKTAQICIFHPSCTPECFFLQ